MFVWGTWLGNNKYFSIQAALTMLLEWKHCHGIECHGCVVSTSALYLGDPGFKSQPGDHLFWLNFSWFSSVPLHNAGTVP